MTARNAKERCQGAVQRASAEVTRTYARQQVAAVAYAEATRQYERAEVHLAQARRWLREEKQKAAKAAKGE